MKTVWLSIYFLLLAVSISQNWEMKNKISARFPMDIIEVYLNFGQLATITITWDENIDIDSCLMVLGGDFYSCQNRKAYGGNWTIGRESYTYNPSASGYYYIYSFLYEELPQDVEFRTVVTVQGVNIVDKICNTKKSYQQFQITDICASKIQILGGYNSTILQLKHSTANVAHYLTASITGNSTYFLNFQRGGQWNVKLYLPRVYQAYDIKSINVTIYSDTSKQYLNPLTKICKIPCSSIPHAINSITLAYECTCLSGYYWNSQTLTCDRKCGMYPLAFIKQGSTEECECPVNYSWNSQALKCKIVCSQISGTVGTKSDSECQCGPKLVWDAEGKVCTQISTQSKKLMAIILICQAFVLCLLVLVLLYCCFKDRILTLRKQNMAKSLKSMSRERAKLRRMNSEGVSSDSGKYERLSKEHSPFKSLATRFGGNLPNTIVEEVKEEDEEEEVEVRQQRNVPIVYNDPAIKKNRSHPVLPPMIDPIEQPRHKQFEDIAQVQRQQKLREEHLAQEEKQYKQIAARPKVIIQDDKDPNFDFFSMEQGISNTQIQGTQIDSESKESKENRVMESESDGGNSFDF